MARSLCGNAPACKARIGNEASFRRNTARAADPRKQAPTLDGAGNDPVRSGVSRKIEEAAIIFRITDHHQGIMTLFGCGCDKCFHQLSAKTSALDFGHDGNGADKSH